MWIKTFYWLRLFESTSFYIRLIIETMKDIKFFLILFILILFTFANAILIMDQGRTERYTVPYFGTQVVDVLFDQYLLSLGEFNGDGYLSEGANKVLLVMFVVGTFLTQITFLNMLIAIMGDTFDRVSEIKE